MPENVRVLDDAHVHALAGSIALQGMLVPLVVHEAGDAFDSMVSVQPYRDSRSMEDALDELIRCAGTQFDPTVVQALVALADDGELDAAEERAA